MKALEAMRPVLSECLKNGLDVDKSLEIIEKETGVDKKLASEIINKYKPKSSL